MQPYGTLIIAYLFLGGAAAGALFVISTWSLQLRWSHSAVARSRRLSFAFSTLRTRVYVAGLLLLVAAMIFLLWDLGFPDRAFMVFVYPHPTVITFGAWTLIVEATLAALLASTHLFRRPNLNGWALSAMEVACCIGALATMAYTGVFLFTGSIAFWKTGALVGLFTFSSLSAGVSVVLLIDWFTQGQTLLLRAAKPLQKCHLACLAVESIFLAVFVLNAMSNPAAQPSLELLSDSEMFSTALIGVVGFGIALPAALEFYSLTRIDCRTIPVSDVACLLGCLTLRYVVIACGAH